MTAIKRQLSIFFAVITASSLLAGCTGKTSTDSGTLNSSAQQSSESAAQNGLADDGGTTSGDYAALTDRIIARYAELPKEERSEIAKQLQPEDGAEYVFSYIDDEGGYQPDSPTCYGQFGDYSIWVFWGCATAVTEKEIAGYVFRYGNDFSLMAYKDGEKSELGAVYDKGGLTKEDIAELCQIHSEFVTVFFGE